MKYKIYIFLFLLLPLLSSCIEIETNINIRGSMEFTKSIKISSNRALVSPDGNYLYTLTTSEDIYDCSLINQWDISSGTIKKTYLPDNYFREDFWHFTSMALNPDGKYLAGSGVFINQGRIHSLVIWDVETGKEVFSINPETNYKLIQFTPDGRKIYMMKKLDRIDIIELLGTGFNSYREDSLLLQNSDYSFYRNMTFSKDGKYLSFDVPSFIKLKESPTVVNNLYGNFAVLNPSTERLIVSWLYDIEVYNLANLEKISSFEDEIINKNTAMGISPDGKYFATSYTADGSGSSSVYGLQVFSAKNGELIAGMTVDYPAEELRFINENSFYTLSFGKFYIYHFSE